MKTFVRVLSIIAMMFAFIACSEDIYLHNGEDGLDGKDGVDGKDGYSLSVFVDPIFNVTIYYWDINNDGEFNFGDIIIKEEPKEGIRLTQVGECVQISEIVGTVAVDSFLVCNGEDGEPGTPGQDGEDGEDGQDGQSGQNGQDGKTVFIYPPFIEDFNTLSSAYYFSEGWRSSAIGGLGIYSGNHNGAPNGNGTLVIDDYNDEPDTIWTPEFSEPTAVDYFSCDMGSKEVWKVELFFKLKTSSGIITVPVATEEIVPVNNFLWYDPNTYTQEFVYQVDINDIEYQNVIRVGLRVSKVGDFSVPEVGWRNYTFNADNLYIHRIKIIQ